jgi:NAD(P)-dependent dehydrogenase (short-subunit alcohol dehydrogenase family)
VFTAGESLELAPLSDLTPEVITRFFQTRFIGALTKALAFELAPIRVNAIAPGVVRTPLWDAMGEADRQAMYDQAAQQPPLGRVAEVGYTARAYLYCMEQEFGTGVVLTVDGGTTLV